MIHTIGHSTRTTAGFLELLRANGINHLVDIRSFPGSRHNPQFGQSELCASLIAANIAYSHMPSLGGMRHSPKGFVSINMAWRNPSFRSFADHMQTPEFDAGIALLIQMSEQSHIAIMCSEAVPWRCHRSLVSDALVARGVPVQHIMSVAKTQPHSLIPFAHVDGVRVTYPGEQAVLALRLRWIHEGNGPWGI